MANYKTKVKSYLDPETGQYKTFREKTSNFDEMDEIGWNRTNNSNLGLFFVAATKSKKAEIVKYILENIDTKNQIIVTQEGIAEVLGISYPMVNATFKNLIEDKFLIKKEGMYILNPYVIAPRKKDYISELIRLYDFVNPQYINVKDNMIKQSIIKQKEELRIRQEQLTKEMEALAKREKELKEEYNPWDRIGEKENENN